MQIQAEMNDDGVGLPLVTTKALEMYLEEFNRTPLERYFPERFERIASTNPLIFTYISSVGKFVSPRVGMDVLGLYRLIEIQARVTSEAIRSLVYPIISK